MNRVMTKLRDAAEAVWFRRPVLRLNSQIADAVDEATLKGWRDAREYAREHPELPDMEPSGELDIAAAVLMATIAGKIATGQISDHDLRQAVAALDALGAINKPRPTRQTVRTTSAGNLLAVVA